MKSCWFVFVGMMLVLSSWASPGASPAPGQQSGQTELSAAAIRADRVSILEDALELTDTEARDFWPIYERYKGEMSMLVARHDALLQEIDRDWHGMQDKAAGRKLTELLKIESDVGKVKSKYRKDFEKALPTKKVLLFYDVDFKLDSIIRADKARSRRD